MPAIVAGSGADFILFDMEHTGLGYETLKHMIAGCRGLDVAPLVRVPTSEYHFIARALDLGAHGIMVPMVESRAQAEHMAWGTGDEVAERIIAEAEQAGAGTILLMCNRGGLPKDQFIDQIRRIGAEVLPKLHAKQITRVPYAEGVD